MGLQLWIHNCTDGSAIMCVWNECTSGRESNEIILRFLEYLARKQPKAEEIIVQTVRPRGTH